MPSAYPDYIYGEEEQSGAYGMGVVRQVVWGRIWGRIWGGIKYVGVDADGDADADADADVDVDVDAEHECDQFAVCTLIVLFH